MEKLPVRADALAEVVHELLHALHPHFLYSFKVCLRFPQRRDVFEHLPASRITHRLATKASPYLVEQPRTADDATTNHQAARLGLVQHVDRLVSRVNVTVCAD